MQITSENHEICVKLKNMQLKIINDNDLVSKFCTNNTCVSLSVRRICFAHVPSTFTIEHYSQLIGPEVMSQT